MTTALLIYAAITVTLLCIIEVLRIKQARKKGKDNISHGGSVWIACISAAIVFVACNYNPPHIPFLKALGLTVAYLLGFGGVRLLFWDPALALWRRQNPFKNSLTSSSKTEQYENKHGIGFWQQRGLGGLCIGISLFINYLITK